MAVEETFKNLEMTLKNSTQKIDKKCNWSWTVAVAVWRG